MRLSVLPTRSVAWLSLGCHLLVASGLPLPVVAPPADAPSNRVTKDRSRPFPCMDKPCGCATAEQCFANCCCHTPAQRLAWAKAHRVEPAVLAALERRVAAHTEAPAGCCAADDVDLEGPDVCRDYRSLAADPMEPAPVSDGASDPPGRRIVILRDVLACSGIATALLGCGPALPPPARAVAPAGDSAAIDRLVLRDDVAASFSADLPAPPPRAV